MSNDLTLLINHYALQDRVTITWLAIGLAVAIGDWVLTGAGWPAHPFFARWPGIKALYWAQIVTIFVILLAVNLFITL